LESYDEAEREYLDCYDMSDSVPDVKAKGVCFLNLGIVLTRRGLYRRAHGPLEKALAIFEKHGTNHDIGKALLNLGSLYAHTGNLKKGFRYLKRARSRVIASFSKDDIALLLKVLGPLYRQAGKPFWFMLFSQSAYQWYRIAGNKRGMADELCNIAIALKDLGHRDLASGALRECLALSNEIKYYTGMGASFVNLASILQESEEFDEAIQWIENALSEFQRTGHWVGYITCLGLLGDWNRNRENPENAIEYHKKALVLSDKIGYHKGVRVSTYALLEDFRSLSQVDKFLHVVEPFLVKYPDIRNEVENWTSRE
ncbi:MAG: tetratricopeptide repeat protein, partial [Thermoplasmata archaeon]